MEKEIISIVQLPIIEERLQQIKEAAVEKIEAALSLECTEETVKSIKSLRAELNKDFNALEDKRKEVKKEVLKPFEAFEDVYNDCVKNVYKDGISKLDDKVKAVENGLKSQKREAVEVYFNEYLASKNIDFVTFENAGINITLTASLKSLKEQAKAFVDRICDDLNLIEVQEYKDEILYCYKTEGNLFYLNASEAITYVIKKQKAIEEQRVVEEKRAQSEKSEPVKQDTSDTSTKNESLSAPTVVEEEKTYIMRFAVRGTKNQLTSIKRAILECGAEILGGNDNE